MCEKITYTRRSDGIYHAVFIKSDTDACDQFVEKQRAFITAHPVKEPFRMMVDIRPGGVPPVRYVFNIVNDMYNAIPPNQLPQIYAAYIYKDRSMLSFMQIFLELLRLKARRRFFPDTDSAEADAVAWLLAQS